jgi:anti-anti-sigma regulatory factor
VSEVAIPPAGHVAPAPPRGAVRLGLDETLDSGAVERAMEILEQAPAGTKVILDFSGVRSVDYAALATLISALAEQGASGLTLQGLCAQHWRVLRYLGLSGSCRDGRDEAVERFRVDVNVVDPT